MMTTTPSARCRAMLARVSAYLDGELDRRQCGVVERHCETCPDCAAVVEGLRNTVGVCRDAGDRPLPAAVRRKAQAQIAALLAPPRGRGAAKRRRAKA